MNVFHQVRTEICRHCFVVLVPGDQGTSVELGPPGNDRIDTDSDQAVFLLHIDVPVHHRVGDRFHLLDVVELGGVQYASKICKYVGVYLGVDRRLRVVRLE